MNIIKQQRCSRPYKLLFFGILAAGILGIVFSLHSSLADPMGSVQISTEPERVQISEGIFTLSVTVNSRIPVNTFAVDLHFDPALVSVVAVNHESSIANLWVYTPMYDNASGTISAISGTTEAGGFTGSGTLFTITFKTRTSGATTIGLTKASVLQSDGHGTPVELAELTDTVVTIEPKTVVNNPTPMQTDLLQSEDTYLPNTADEYDLNNDGLRTFSDVGVLIQFLGTNNDRADLNHDGLVTAEDLEILLTHLNAQAAN